MSPEAFAQGLLVALGTYLGAGGMFGVVFVIVAVQRLEPAAATMPLTARLLVLPGMAALWPWLAWRWWRRQAPPVA
jgi:hypothetical protein